MSSYVQFCLRGAYNHTRHSCPHDLLSPSASRNTVVPTELAFTSILWPSVGSQLQMYTQTSPPFATGSLSWCRMCHGEPI